LISNILKLLLDETKIINDCKILMKRNIKCITYPIDINKDNWHKYSKEIQTQIHDFKGNIYFILVPTFQSDANIKWDYEIKYIGKSEKITKRLKEHLVNKSKKTNSCIEEVKNYIFELNGEKSIYISSITIEPEYANSYIETLLQQKLLKENSWCRRKK